MSREKGFYDEQNDLLQYLLETFSYPYMGKAIGPHISLELYVSSHCNKNCEYCYLQKYKTSLYPQEFDKPEIILQNCRMLFEYYIKNNIKVATMDLYSGEIVGTELWFNILDLILEYCEKGLGLQQVMNPTNGYFLSMSDEVVNKVDTYLQKFFDRDIHYMISFSDDGMLDEINRPMASQERQDKERTYQKMAYFSKKYGFGFHPMVNAHSIKLWKDNFYWWKDYLNSIGYEEFLERVMFLEVRNDEWDDESIKYYLDFLQALTQYLVDHYSEVAEPKDILRFLCRKYNGIRTKSGETIHPSYDGNYQPFGLQMGERISCAITQNLCIRLGDLAICPCHRLAYDHLLYGKYLVEDGAITGVQGNNIQLYINNMITGHSGFLKCDVCPITDYCLKGCRGAQYEIHKDMNMPIESVCNFMRAKCMYFLTTIIYYANKYDCTEYLQDSINDFVMVLYNLKQEDEEFYNKWNAIICQYMPEI